MSMGNTAHNCVTRTAEGATYFMSRGCRGGASDVPASQGLRAEPLPLQELAKDIFNTLSIFRDAILIKHTFIVQSADLWDTAN